MKVSSSALYSGSSFAGNLSAGFVIATLLYRAAFPGFGEFQEADPALPDDDTSRPVILRPEEISYYHYLFSRVLSRKKGGKSF
jgi:hypothetical protein